MLHIICNRKQELVRHEFNQGRHTTDLLACVTRSALSKILPRAALLDL
jgi:hypothetical protein